MSHGCPLRTLAEGHLSPRAANDDDLCKTPNTFTLHCTVSHSSFWKTKEHSKKQAVKSSTSILSRDGGTGRRSGLKSGCYLSLSISK
jgi:hypothetical protein